MQAREMCVSLGYGSMSDWGWASRWLVVAWLATGLPVAVRATAADFELREHIGRDWRNERVTFTLSEPLLKQAWAGAPLLDANGTALSYQVLPPAGPEALPRIAFLVDLPPYTGQTYGFGNGRTVPDTDLQIVENPESIRIQNAVTGIDIRRQLAAGEGPVRGFRLASGAWVGDSMLIGDLPVTDYRVELLARGPVSVKAVCRLVLGQDSTWELHVRLDAGEPTVLIRETVAVMSDETRFRVDLNRGLGATHIFHRRSWQDGFRFVLAPLAVGRVFLLQPWQNWFQSQTQGAVFGLVCGVADAASRVTQADLLAVGAGWASDWIDPRQPDNRRQAANAVLNHTADGHLHLDFELKTGVRQWTVSALDAGRSLARQGDRYATTPLPYQVVIKHGQFPLDRVKDQLLAWAHDAVDYPRLLAPRADIEHFREQMPPAIRDDYRQRVPRVVARAIDRYYLDEPIRTWCATGDERGARHIIEGAERHMQEALDCFLVQSVPYGSAPHMTPWLGTAMTLADAALGTDLMSAEQRARLLAKAAFVAYAVDRADYWCPQRGYAGLPNMSTLVYGYLAAAASLVSPHPLARDWGSRALGELHRQLTNWSDDNGGWLEAPHYAMVSYDAILGSFAMAANAGISDKLYVEPRIRAVADWFGKISTPPDTRINGIRHLPHLGHTYLFEPTGTFGTLAYLFRDRNPEFAARMQWLWQEHGAFESPGIASPYPAMAGFRTVMIDPDIPARPPVWASEWFPRTGVILRHGFPGPRETQLYLIAGAHRSHYDDDSGAFTLWGKGRIVADMFGYCGASPARDHSLVESPLRGRIMTIDAFAVTAALDYTTGLAGGWRRQVAFVKDSDPLGANYFLVGDSFERPTTPTWRLWLAAADARLDDAPSRDRAFAPEAGSARQAWAHGHEDVDTDIFFARPETLLLRTEALTREAGSGLYPDGRQNRMSMTQIGLIAEAQDVAGMLAVIYPRLRTESPPVFTALAGGIGVKIDHAAGSDTVFMSPLPVHVQVDGLAFHGTVGAVLLRGDQTILALGAAGRITARGRLLESAEAVSQSWREHPRP